MSILPFSPPERKALYSPAPTSKMLKKDLNASIKYAIVISNLGYLTFNLWLEVSKLCHKYKFLPPNHVRIDL